MGGALTQAPARFCRKYLSEAPRRHKRLWVAVLWSFRGVGRKMGGCKIIGTSALFADAEEVPEDFRSRLVDGDVYKQTASPFDLYPRAIKDLFRLGLNIQDVDQPKAFPAAMVARHPWSIHLRQWAEARGGWETNLKSNQKVTPGPRNVTWEGPEVTWEASEVT